MVLRYRKRLNSDYSSPISLSKGELQPLCVSCNEALTIDQLLTNCDLKNVHHLIYVWFKYDLGQKYYALQV